MSGKVEITITGYVRQLRYDGKTIRFAIPVYAGGKDENVETKWFEIKTFLTSKYAWLREGMYVSVKRPLLRVMTGRTKRFEDWVVGDYYGDITLLKDLNHKHEDTPNNDADNGDDAFIEDVIGSENPKGNPKEDPKEEDIIPF